MSTPAALHYAEVLESFYLGLGRIDATGAAAELRRLHAENEELRTKLAAVQAPAPVDAGLTDAQIERAWRLGFKAACDAERLNATEEWGYKGANVIEDVQGLVDVARGVRAHVARQAQAPA